MENIQDNQQEFERFIPLGKFFEKNDYIIDWVSDRSKEISDLLWEGIPDIVESYCETETYMLTNKFLKWYTNYKENKCGNANSRKSVF
jgi:hypothetical protein